MCTVRRKPAVVSSASMPCTAPSSSTGLPKLGDSSPPGTSTEKVLRPESDSTWNEVVRERSSTRRVEFGPVYERNVWATGGGGGLGGAFFFFFLLVRASATPGPMGPEMALERHAAASSTARRRGSAARTSATP